MIQGDRDKAREMLSLDLELKVWLGVGHSWRALSMPCRAEAALG